MGDPADQGNPHGEPPRRRRRRYAGTHPRHYEERYKEHNPEAYPEIQARVRARGGTPAGTHVPVLLAEVLTALQPEPGEVVADCTLGYGAHAAAFLERTAPDGLLFGFDVDAQQLERTRGRLADFGDRVRLTRGNFAGLHKVLTPEMPGFDVVFADLGVSSMQIDDPRRGFSYKHDGPLDMRMDDRIDRTAADLLATIEVEALAEALRRLANEPDHLRIARRVAEVRSTRLLMSTWDLVRLVFEAKGLSIRQWKRQHRRHPGERHPAARTFQALRIMVNDELGCLAQLLRIAPSCLNPGGRIGIISFHSGEDRLVEESFRQGLADGLYEAVSERAITPGIRERRDNPRSRSAKLRWARRVDERVATKK